MRRVTIYTVYLVVLSTDIPVLHNLKRVSTRVVITYLKLLRFMALSDIVKKGVPDDLCSDERSQLLNGGPNLYCLTETQSSFCLVYEFEVCISTSEYSSQKPYLKLIDAATKK